MWGSVVNLSRNFARQSLLWLPQQQAAVAVSALDGPDTRAASASELPCGCGLWLLCMCPRVLRPTSRTPPVHVFYLTPVRSAG